MNPLYDSQTRSMLQTAHILVPAVKNGRRIESGFWEASGFSQVRGAGRGHVAAQKTGRARIRKGILGPHSAQLHDFNPSDYHPTGPFWTIEIPESGAILGP
jgi:hypothetical protein